MHPRQRGWTVSACQLVIALFVFFLPVLAVAQQSTTTFNGQTALSGEVLIRLKGVDAATVSRVQKLLPSGTFSVLSSSLGLYLVRLPGALLTTLLQIFSNSTDVHYVEQNYVLQSTATPNDP